MNAPTLAEVPASDARQVYRIALWTPCPGIGWFLVWRRTGEIARASGGAFYDGAHDHPEGAIAWACASAAAHRQRTTIR